MIEPAIGGLTAKPMFIGRIDVVDDPRWGGELLVPGGASEMPAGALVFTLDGQFIGLAVPRHGGHGDGGGLAPVTVLQSAMTALSVGGLGPAR